MKTIYTKCTIFSDAEFTTNIFGDYPIIWPTREKWVLETREACTDFDNLDDAIRELVK